MTQISISEDDFDKRFNPIHNHINNEAPFDGTMFETFGKELEYVYDSLKDEKKKRTLWTIVEGDEGELYYESGFHYVNRLGYFFTEEQILKDDLGIIVPIEMVSIE